LIWNSSSPLVSLFTGKSLLNYCPLCTGLQYICIFLH
jgi:hypothetical protein